MKRTAFAIAVGAVALAAVSGGLQAAPIAPLPAGIAAGHDNLTEVQYWRWHHPWRWHHRRCFWARGRWHCRW